MMSDSAAEPPAGFAEHAAEDVGNVFVDLLDFASIVEIDGVEVMAVVDNVEQAERSFDMGLASSGMRIFAKTESMPRRKKPGSPLTVNQASYIVESWKDDLGMSEVVLIRSQ